MAIEHGDAQAIINAVRQFGEHTLLYGPEAAPPDLALAVLPEGKRIENLQKYIDQLRITPRYIQANAIATSVQSLSDYANRFKLPDSALFLDSDPQKPSLSAVIDYHGGAGGERSGPDETPGSTATPRFGRHRVQYDFPISEQFSAWSAIYGKALSHIEMAEHLADRQYDIANPPLDWMMVAPDTLGLILHLLNIGDDQGEIDDAAADPEPDPEGEDRYVPRSALYKLRRIRFGSAQRLIQLARTVEISVNAKTVEGYNPKTGERVIQFEEEHDARSKGHKVIVPDAFLLRIPVFEGETPQLVPVRLQYRRGAGAVKWFMSLVEWRRVIRYAVKIEAERVRLATGLPLFHGKP